MIGRARDGNRYPRWATAFPVQSDECLPNGRIERRAERKIGFWVAGLSGGYLLLTFLVPLSLPTDTIPDLSGRANVIDYWSEESWGNQQSEEGPMGHDQNLHGGTVQWKELPPLHALVYLFGDVNCHQKFQRSWTLNGNQMPVCTRDIGIFLGAMLGALAFASRGLNRWTVRDTLVSPLPDSWLDGAYRAGRRNHLILLLLALTILPILLDGGIQMTTAYESNNMLRLLTGAIFGLLAGLGFAAMLAARPKSFAAADAVLLPGGARFMLVDDESE